MEITVDGFYASGSNRFAVEILLPGKDVIGIEEWSVVKGTFNVRVAEESLLHCGLLGVDTKKVKALDRNPDFKPAAYLRYDAIPNNTLYPGSNGRSEYCGDLQIWRCCLSLPRRDMNVDCFVFRRVDSGYRYIVEIVSDTHISSRYGVNHGEPVSLTISSV